MVKNKKIRFAALLMAILLIFTVAGCKENGATSSVPDEIVYVDEFGNVISGPISGDSDDSGEDSPSDSTSPDASTSSGNNSSSGKNPSSGNNSSSGKNPSSGNNSSSGKNPSSGNNSSSGKNPSSGNSGSSNNGKVDPKDYKGTTVTFATWKNPDDNEDGPVVEAFEKKYNIKVNVKLVGQGNYINTLLGLIAANEAPDVYFCNGDFPAALSCLQPIDAAKFDLSDPIWDKGTIDKATINGKAYLVNTVGNIWNEMDCVFYNKKLLQDNNITTPEDYYKAGKWTFDTLEKVMTDVKNLGSSYVGGYIDYRSLIGSTGAGYYKFNNGTFSNGISSLLTDVNRRMSTWTKNGLIRGVDNESGVKRDEFLNGKVGIAITNAFGLKKTGYWQKMKASDIGFTYMPDYDSSHKAVNTGMLRGWGICEGAKNPVAAGIFLRYYLDVNNYDTNSAFINSSAKTFFFKLTSNEQTKNKNYYFEDATSSILGWGKWEFASIINGDPNQVAQKITALSNVLDGHVKTLNDYVKKHTS